RTNPATVWPLVTACTSIRRVATAALLAMTAMALPRAAWADPISAKKAQAERLATQIDVLGDKESALAERYNQATLNAANVQAKVDRAKANLAQAAKATDAARNRVKSVAVAAYVRGLAGLSADTDANAADPAGAQVY